MAKKPTYKELEKRIKELETKALGSKQVEEALLESEKSYRTLVEQSLQGLLVIQDFRIVFTNTNFAEISGFSVEELLALSPEEVRAIIHPDDQKFVWERFRNRLEGKPEPPRYEYRGIRKDGIVVWLEIFASRIYYGGRPAIQGAIIDITERKKTEEELRVERDNLRNIFESIEDGIDIVNQQYNIQYVNPVLVKDFGPYEGVKCYRYFYDRDEVCPWCKNQDVWAGKTVRLEWYSSKNGRTYDMIDTPLTLPDGSIGKLEIFHDITDIKQTEKALRESEKKYRTILESIEDGYYEVDLAGNFTFFNDSMCEISGYSRDELMGMNYRQYTNEQDSEKLYNTFNKVYTTGKPSEIMDHMMVRKDETKRYIELSASLIKDSKDHGIGARGIIRDVTERKHAQEEIAKRQKYLESVVHNAPDAIVTLDASHNIIEWNPGAKRIFGYSRDEVVGKDIDDLISRPDMKHELKALTKQLLSGERLIPHETVRYRKDGTPVNVIASGSSIKIEDKFLGVMAVYTDITEKKKLERQLQQAQKMEAIGTLAGGIAHDFNNILAAIIGFAELAKMRVPEDSEILPNLDQILKSGNRAKTLIQQILAFSRKQELEQKPLQLKYIIMETLKLLRSTLPTDIEIKEDIAQDVGVVNADPTQMHQVIMNLCTNAGHAMQEEGGVLAVGFANVELDDIAAAQYLDMSPGHYLRLSVSDTGHGMTPDVKERIFEPYFTTKEKGVGTGMGLSVVHGIVKNHNGEVTVYSEPGKGSTFHVYLPLIQEEAIKPEMDEQAPILTGNERILFIDDEPTLVELGTQMLERLGYEVTTRTSSIEALELFKAQPDRFDLVITDMTMPNMMGDKLAQEFMKIRSDIPIILCTGFSERISEEKTKEIGIKAFAMKPLVMRGLANTIKKVIDT